VKKLHQLQRFRLIQDWLSGIKRASLWGHPLNKDVIFWNTFVKRSFP
jgi:hypothetical protein